MGRSGGHSGGRSGGGGGFSGGSRSSGSFSGGRSSSHRSSSSSRSGGRSYYSGGGYRPPPPPGPHYHRHVYYGGGYRSGGGCLSALLSFVFSVILIIFLMVFFTGAFSSSSGSVNRSTVKREALPMSASYETSYYTDEAGWISNPSEIERGLKIFYHETGVQPHVYITDGSHGTTESELQAFAVSEYDELFQDEAHFLLVFYDDGYGSYFCGYEVGSEAKTVMDNEAIGILADYLDRYYNDTAGMSDEDFFGTSFEKTGERIMTVTKSPTVKIVAILAGVMIVIIAFAWWTKARKAKAEKAKETERILSTPIEKLGDQGLKDLEDKYSE